MPELHAEELVIDAREEAYLRGAFRRFAWPYFAGMLALVAALWFLAPDKAPAPSAASPSEHSAALQAEIAKLSAELESVHELAREARRVASTRASPAAAPEPAPPRSFDSAPEWRALVARLNAMTTRVKTLETRPSGRVERIVMHAETPALADGATNTLLERIFNIEQRQEREEQQFRETQKSMLDRVYAIESRRDATMVERTALDQSVLSRMKNLEDRFYAMERRESESQPAAPER